jgi:hypothetical protein
MKFIGYWSKQLIVAEFDELLACRHYYRDGEYCEEGYWVVKASLGRGAGVREYYLCPSDKYSKEGYRPFLNLDEANDFIERTLRFGTDNIDLRSHMVVCAFMEDTYAKVKLLDKREFSDAE